MMTLSDHKYIEFRITTELLPIPQWRNPRATQWDAYIADLEEAMGGRIRRIWTEEDIHCVSKKLGPLYTYQQLCDFLF